jgi:hypothetical protein
MDISSSLIRFGETIVRRSLLEVVYLFASFLRPKPRKFRAISEKGTLFDRVALTTALALTCALVTIFILLMDPLELVDSPAKIGRYAAWSALAPLLAIPPLYPLLKRHTRQRTFFTLLNLGLVTTAALIAIPGLLQVASINFTSFGSDSDRLKAGRAAGTHLHRIYCGNFEDRAAMQATMNALQRNTVAQQQIIRETLTNYREGLRARDRVETLGRRLYQQRLAGHGIRYADLIAFDEADQHAFSVSERALEIAGRSYALLRQGLRLQERGLSLQDRITKSPLRLAAAYPVTTLLFGLALIAGVTIWIFAGAMVWFLTVKEQETRRARWAAGATVVLVFLLLLAGLAALRSAALLEAIISPTISMEMAQAQIRTEFEAAEAWCGRLNNHGAW